MKTIAEFLIVLLIFIGVFFAGRLTAPKQPPEVIIKSDTVTVEKAIPKYITKFVEREGKVDTQYIAKVDTVVDDISLSVSYEANQPIPLGAFSISAITPLLSLRSTTYYVQALAWTSLSESSVVGYKLSAGRYLINKPSIKLGLGGFYARTQRKDYGVEAVLRLEF